MTQNKNIDHSQEKDRPIDTRVRNAFDGMIASRPWNPPARRLGGMSTSVRTLELIDPVTGSQVALTETQGYFNIFGVPFTTGEISRKVKWTIREKPIEKDFRAELTYIDDEYGSSVATQYFNGPSADPIRDERHLGYFYDHGDVYPDPRLAPDSEEGLAEVAFLLEYKVPETFVEQFELPKPL